MKYKGKILGASYTRKTFSEPKIGHYEMMEEKKLMFALKTCT
jgi:hypothetical protein